MPHVIRRWLPVLLWAALIYWLSSVPSLASPFPTLADTIVRKFAHAFEFGALAVLLVRAQGTRSNGALIIAFFLSVLYALTDEFHQSFVEGREPSSVDVLIDSWGAFLAILIIRFRTTKLTGHPLVR